MKRYALVALLAAMLFGVATTVSATELKVKGHLDVYGMWSANLYDFDSEVGDGDNYFTTQRMRTFFTYQANENLKAVLGLEMDNVWGASNGGQWGTDGKGNIEVKHAYLDFNFPDTAINVKAGLQAVALPGVFGNPVFDDDAAALVISAPINEMFGLAIGYSRGVDGVHNAQTDPATLTPAVGKKGDDIDMFFLAAPVTLDGFSATPYFAYAKVGKNSGYGNKKYALSLDLGDVDPDLDGISIPYTYTEKVKWTDDADIWVLGANAALTMFDPFTLEADLIYGELKAEEENKSYKSKGWYAALAASYKMDMMTPVLFATYFSGADKKDNKDNMLPQLAEGWGITPYIGGVRAFGTTYDTFSGVDNACWAIGLKLADINFVDNLSHELTIAYAQGTSDKYEYTDVAFDKKSSAWEVYFVNKYMIYENLAAINELGYFAPDFNAKGLEDDASYFATIGFSYKF